VADPIQGYFNSTTFTPDANGFPIWNRAVGSEFMAKFAHTVLGNGAAAVTTGGFQVVKKTGMIVTVKPYFICKDGYMMYQTAETDIEFTSSTSEQVFYIGARLDVANNHFDGDDVGAFTTFVSATDIASCKLTITANAVAITDGMIEDLRYNPAYCGQIDQYRETGLSLLEELETQLAIVIAGGVPDHASTHAVGGDDELTDFVSVSAQTIADADQTQARTNISAAKAVGGVIDAIESGMVVNEQTDDYTAVLTDVGKDVWITHADAKAFTIPPQSSVAFLAKSYFFVTRGGAGALTIAGGSGVTVNSAGSRLKIAEQYGTVLVRRTAEDVWLVTGALSS
jgi:hypothetical protein